MTETSNRMNRLERRITRRQRGKKGNLWAGLVLIAVGALLVSRQFGVYYPEWIFSWEMIVVVIGILVGMKSGFRDYGWAIIIGIGLIFLFDDIFQEMPVHQYGWPILITAVGVFVLMSGLGSKREEREEQKQKQKEKEKEGEEGIVRGEETVEEPEGPPAMPASFTGDLLEVVSVFGMVKKIVVSKSFKGGEIVAVFGGSEINMTNADFSGKIVLEVVGIFGGTKLIIPPHWEVQSTSAAVFGSIEDKRPQPAINPDKVLVIDGVAVFGGIEITSY